MQALPDNAELIIGNITETVPKFIKTLSKESPVGFISVDVDYYWSAKECLTVLLGEPEKYLPMTVVVYLDDIGVPSANPWVGELLAVNEFNAEHLYKKFILTHSYAHREYLSKHAGLNRFLLCTL